MAETGEKIYTIIKTRKGRDTVVSGTIEELEKYFGYTLEVGKSWQKNPTIKLKDHKSIKSFLNDLKKATDIKESQCYERTYFTLLDTVLKKCSKREDYFVEYEITQPGIEVYNKLEDAHYVTDEEHNVILTGTVGEQWVTTIEKLDKTYRRDKNKDRGDASPIGSESYFYEIAKEDQEIQTSWGTTLQAKKGDVIIYANENSKPNIYDRWVVDKKVFKNTYNY